MRTTLIIEDRIANDLKEIVRSSGKLFQVVVNEALQAGLRANRERQKPRRYRLRAVSLGAVRPQFDLDKALTLAGSLEDEQWRNEEKGK